MTVRRFASAMVVGMLAGGLTAMSGIGKDDASAPPSVRVASALERGIARAAATVQAGRGHGPAGKDSAWRRTASSGSASPASIRIT